MLILIFNNKKINDDYINLLFKIILISENCTGKNSII